MEYYTKVSQLIMIMSVLLLSMHIAATADHTKYDDEHQHINASQAYKKQIIRLPIIHRDNFINVSANITVRLQDRLHRDFNRMVTLSHRITTSQSDMQDNDDYQFGSRTISGQDQGIFEFLVEVKIGTPPTTQHLILDTGSDLTWFQCGPCLHCYKQTDPIIDWSYSSSLTVMGCDNRACDHWFLGYSEFPAGVPRVSGILSGLDTCFDLYHSPSLEIPTISFYFSTGTILTLASQNILIQIFPNGPHCLAFAPTFFQFSVIGNVQMQDIVVTYDVLNSRVGFTAYAC
ncbi:hypothetical protein ACFE04_001556 [Oxalis oulophora]